jgi:xanthine dehydrogenase accessory factor
VREIAGDLARWLADGERVVLATVVSVEGSSPRPLGARLAVSASGLVAGSVSGGCVEGAVVEEAADVFQGRPPKRLRYGVADETGFEVGLACGGTIDVYVEPLVSAHRRLLVAVETGETVAMATRLSDGAHLLGWSDGSLEGDPSLAPGLAELFPGPAAQLRTSPDGDTFLEVIAPPPELIIVGAVHVAIPLVQLAQTVGFRVRLVDPRRTFANLERFPTVDDLTVAWPQDALRSEDLGPHHYLVVLSHDPKLDLPALEIGLRSRAGYIGLIGSPTTQGRRRRALQEAGIGVADLARVHGPVGLDLGGQEPAEIALAILAEIVAVRRGRLRDQVWAH